MSTYLISKSSNPGKALDFRSSTYLLMAGHQVFQQPIITKKVAVQQYTQY